MFKKSRCVAQRQGQSQRALRKIQEALTGTFGGSGWSRRPLPKHAPTRFDRTLACLFGRRGARGKAQRKFACKPAANIVSLGSDVTLKLGRGSADRFLRRGLSHATRILSQLRRGSAAARQGLSGVRILRRDRVVRARLRRTTGFAGRRVRLRRFRSARVRRAKAETTRPAAVMVGGGRDRLGSVSGFGAPVVVRGLVIQAAGVTWAGRANARLAGGRRFRARSTA